MFWGWISVVLASMVQDINTIRRAIKSKLAQIIFFYIIQTFSYI